MFSIQAIGLYKNDQFGRLFGQTVGTSLNITHIMIPQTRHNFEFL